MTEEERRALAERERLQREEQQRTDDLVRSWVRVPVPPSANERDEGPGSVARPDGLSFSTMLVRSIREDAREADWVASTQAVDSYDTIIQQDWDGEHKGLDRYRKNPVILFAHDSWALPIGRATQVAVENPNTEAAALVTTVKFATAKANPMAEFCWQSVLEKTLRGMSVGWRPGAWERREINGVMRSIAVRNTLYEQSVCPVPSNPEALQRTCQRAFGERVWSFPTAQPERRTPQPQTPAVPTAVTARDKRTMKTIIIDKASVGSIRRDHVAEVRDGDDTFRISIPSLVEVDADMRTTTERAAVAEKRVADLTTERDGLTKRVADAEERAAKAATAQADAEKARDAAIAERATVELEPLTGADHWQFTPAERAHVAKLAATDPTTYRSMVDERRAKGVSAGALKREEPAGHLPTRATDPTPRNTPATGGKPATRSDDALFASAERQAEKQADQRTPQLDAAS